MKRLLWKEFRERRWWALVWLLAIVGVSLFAGGQAFFSEEQIIPHPAQVLPLVFGLLVGLGGYSSELSQGRAQSVFARPISGTKLLAVKILFGAVIALAAPLMAAVIEGIIMPAPYRHLISGPGLLLGALSPAWKNGLVYLLGLACSTIIPGLAGGMLTLISAVIVTIAVWIFSPANGWISSYEPPHVQDIAKNIHIFSARVGLILGAGFGAMLAGLSLTHSTLVLGHDVRVKHFTFRFLPILLAGLLAGCLLPQTWLQRALFQWEVAAFRPNQSAAAALVFEELCPRHFDYALPVEYDRLFRTPYGRREYLIGMRDGRQLPISDYQGWQWLLNGYAVGHSDREKALYIFNVNTWKMAVLNNMENIQLLDASPNGRILAAKHFKPEMHPGGATPERSASNRMLIFIHLPTRRILKEEPWPAVMVSWRWETNNLFSYRYAPSEEAWGRREPYRTHTIRVTD